MKLMLKGFCNQTTQYTRLNKGETFRKTVGCIEGYVKIIHRNKASCRGVPLDPLLFAKAPVVRSLKVTIMGNRD